MPFSPEQISCSPSKDIRFHKHHSWLLPKSLFITPSKANNIQYSNTTTRTAQATTPENNLHSGVAPCLVIDIHGINYGKGESHERGAEATLTSSMSTPVPQSHIITQYRNQIWHSLDNNLISTALFTAERLQAYDPRGGDSVHLLALCYFRDGQIKTAEYLTRGWSKHVGCAYINAQCCLELGGGKEKDGIVVLERCKNQWLETSSWSEFSSFLTRWQMVNMLAGAR